MTVNKIGNARAPCRPNPNPKIILEAECAAAGPVAVTAPPCSLKTQPPHHLGGAHKRGARYSSRRAPHPPWGTPSAARAAGAPDHSATHYGEVVSFTELFSDWAHPS